MALALVLGVHCNCECLGVATVKFRECLEWRL